MARLVEVHPKDPHVRRLAQVADALRDGAIVAYPTDACYVLGFAMGDKRAADRVRALRKLDDNHHFTLQAATIGQISSFAKLDNSEFKFINNLSPGPYTFIVSASRELPKRLWNQKRRTCGIRFPDHAVVHGILEQLNEPVMTTTLELPGSDHPLIEADDVEELVGKHIDIVVDSGETLLPMYSTVIDCTQWPPRLIREGVGGIPDGVVMD